MFSNSHICASCLRTISRRHIRLPAQSWQSKAGFVSLETKNAQTDVDSGNDIIPVPEPQRNKDGQKSRRIPRTRFKRKETRAAILEDLFEESAHILDLSNERKTKTQEGAYKLSLEAYAKDEKLGIMLKDRTQPLAEIWDFFTSELGPQAWTSGQDHITQPIMFKIHARELYKKLMLAKAHNPLDETLPPVAQIVQTYDQLGFLTVPEICQALTQLLKTLQTPLSMKDREEGLTDLLNLWEIFRNILHRLQGRINSQYGNPEVPPRPLMHHKQWSRSRGVEGLFQGLLPTPQTYTKNIAALAVMTFAFATDGRVLSNLGTNPFLLSVAEHLSGAHVTFSELHRLLASEGLVHRFPKVDLNTVLERADQIATSLHDSPTGKNHHSRFKPLDIYKRLFEAQHGKDLKSLEGLWEECQLDMKKELSKNTEAGSEPSIEPEQAERLPSILSEKLYTRFIHAFMVLGQPDKALNVWNVMVENSVSPSLMTWNTLLEGCGMTRQWSALETIWARCLASGQLPDMQLWTTRINGLMGCGQDRRALQALKEMRTSWETAAKNRAVKDLKSAGDIDGIVKPSTSTINAIIAGLLRHGKLNYAQQVLAWGDEIGIKPDIYTFNILLRSLVKQNKLEGIVSLLKQMQKQHVQPDAATFTTILDELFKEDTDYSHEEQAEIVNGIFDEMAAAGIQANEWTYSKTIHSLLRQSNTTAVKSLLERMATQHVQPSPHLYTALVDWYFAQTPPNLDGVGRLLERAKHSEKKLDHVFWNQVVDGYARAGDTANALIYLAKVDMDATWSTLEAVLVALVKNDERDMAKELVRNTKADKAGPPVDGEHSTAGQRMFWESVADLNLDDEQSSQ